jgi:hypothetical protein
VRAPPPVVHTGTGRCGVQQILGAVANAYLSANIANMQAESMLGPNFRPDPRHHVPCLPGSPAHCVTLPFQDWLLRPAWSACGVSCRARMIATLDGKGAVGGPF